MADEKKNPEQAPDPETSNRDDQGRLEYRIMKNAGDWIAGKRSPGPGKTVRLTDEQAEHYIRTGQIKKV